MNRRIEVSGINLSVVDEGEGPPVIFLHGFPDSSRMWRHQIKALTAEGFRCIAPDLRGFGESDKPPNVEDYGIGLVLGDVTGMMDQLGIEKAAVVGHDWGAGVGWILATFLQERIERHVAISVGHPGGFAPPIYSQLQKSWYMLFFQLRDLAEETLQRDDWALFRQWLHGAVDTDAYIEDMSRPGALTAGLNWYRANIPAETFVGQPREFPPIDIPVMGIWSAHDPYLTEELMLRSAEHVADWRYERFDDAGHWIPLDQPDRLNQLLIEFLKVTS